MKKKSVGIILLAAVLFGSAVSPLGAAEATAPPASTPPASAPQASAEPGPWSFDIVPYLWLATYGGTFDLPGAPAGLGTRTEAKSASSDPFSTHISAAAMLLGQVRYKDIGFVFDGAWLQLKTDGNAPSDLYSGTQIKSDIGFATLELSYRLPPLGKLQTELVAGARIWHVSMTMDFEAGIAPATSTEDSRTWYDPVVGARLRYDFTRHWYAVVFGDAGGFGAGADLEYEVFGGVGYQFTSVFSATLGYRYMHIDYSDNNFAMDVGIQGFLLGLGFRF